MHGSMHIKFLYECLVWSTCKELAESYLKVPYVDTCGGTAENQLYVTVRVDGLQNF